MSDYLYHYTSVDTLELILKNKTIRFNPLTKMDDKLEKWSAHGKQEGSHVFISSWTESEHEIPRMWKQYCRPNPSIGVRIRLIKNPFSNEKNHLPYGIKEAVTEMITAQKMVIQRVLHKNVNGYEEIKKLLPVAFARDENVRLFLRDLYNEISHNKISCNPQNVENLLVKVEYTDEYDKIYPTMYYDYKGNHFEDYSQYGKYKDTSWSWQNEWRYRLHFRMLTPGIRRSDGTIELYELPFEYYDLILDDEKMKDMQVLLSPTISEKAREKVHDIVLLHNPTAEIIESKLTEL